MILKFFEFKKESIYGVIDSFKLKDELPPKIWNNFEINDEIRQDLIRIARDFYENVEFETDIIDIVLCGSLCNYNWSERYSDYDLHIIIDFSKINEDVELVKKTCNYAKKIWNNSHEIKIRGYEVEIGLQDEEDLKESIKLGKMGGVFSLLNNRWIKKPEKAEFEMDEKLIAEKAESVMMSIDDLEENEYEYDKFLKTVLKIWEKIKNYRKSGLSFEGGELSVGNLVFKLLRRNGYIGKVMELKRKTYDKQFN